MKTRVAIWIDHHEANVFHVDATRYRVSTILAPTRESRHEKMVYERDHPADAQRFFHEVARAVEDATEILVLGPATAKLEFVKHVERHDRAVRARIVGVESADHPSFGQIVALARKHFRALDRMDGEITTLHAPRTVKFA
jgi:stalled ribosome rescue protein Dom34